MYAYPIYYPVIEREPIVLARSKWRCLSTGLAAMAHYKPGVVLERNRDKAGAGAAYRAAIAADPQHAGSNYN